MRRLLAGCLLALLASPGPAVAADGNALAYLDESDPFYVSRNFPKLTTPQWVGEEEVEAVAILAIDDMREPDKWEAYLRPILNRLKKIDGRAPVSIMTVRIDPRHPQLQSWLKEGLSLEVHTYDHPCPLLAGGDLAKARATYDRCVDLMDAIPGSHAVAFRVPCCDSLNTPSPRFYAEIFNGKTPAGNFLTIDSSVCNLLTAGDPELPRELVVDERGQEIFRRYFPSSSFATTVEDYPYPYVIGKLCWEFPIVVPSDWSAQHLQQPRNPQTLRDLKRALDAVVVKRGVFALVFHPYDWIDKNQIVELIDHAVEKHGKKIKFLNFREAQQRLDKNLLAGQPLRTAKGDDNGVRLLDLNRDGAIDVVIGNAQTRQTRVWSPKENKWIVAGEFPTLLAGATGAAEPRDRGVRFGILHDDGFPAAIVRNEGITGAWHFNGSAWASDLKLLAGLELDGQPFATCQDGRDQGVRLRDLDGDGRCELVVSNPAKQGVFRFQAGRGWARLPYALPKGVTLVDAKGRDAGSRFVDIDWDGTLDLVSSNESGYSAHLFEGLGKGWSRALVAGKPGDASAIPMIARAGTNNGAWLHDRRLFVQNEDTDKRPDLVEQMPLDNLLKDIPYPGPKSPAQSLATTQARPGFQAELMAAEPLVTDPIALAFGPDGKLWVVEMGDYPRGVDGQGGHGGVVRALEDTDGDGRYDRSTVFLDDLGFPNGVMPWRKGILVTCAPDILYAEDTDGDGKADKREILYHGFLQGNPQHRMNGLKWGFDGWVYGAHGDSAGGKIELRRTGGTVNANGRDFRIRPDEGLLDPQSGISQFGRNPDDWGNWFGNSNSEPMFQYVLDDYYLRRNKHVPGADGRDQVSENPGAAEVFPRSRTLARFNDLYAANRFTSANSTIVYRDDLFGPAFEGNSFVCEPVHNLVHREIMRPDGLTFTSRRADDEKQSEFLASADNWFRPTNLAVGPDGALWVADMYRQTIEHPEWIPKEIQDQLDLRAGSDMGRIYRVYPIGKQPRKIPRLDKLSTAELVAALDSPSGWQRDMAQQLLVWRADKSAIEPLQALATGSRRPACRLQALWTLELLGGLKPDLIAKGLADPHPGVRRQAIRIVETHLSKSPQLGERIVAMTGDADLPVQLQRAYTLGEWNDPRAGKGLGELALRYSDDRFLTAAILSSVNRGNLHNMMISVLDPEPGKAPPGEILEQLVAMATAFEDGATLAAALQKIGRSNAGRYATWQLTALAGLLDALDRTKTSWEKYDQTKDLAKMFRFARAILANDKADDEERLRAVRLLGRSAAERTSDIGALVALLVPQSSGALQAAAVEALARIDSEQVPAALLAGWRGHGPELRSQILDALLGRDKWSEILLVAVERKQVPASDIDATRRQRLQRSSNERIKSLATRLLAGNIESNRREVVDAHASVLSMQGDAQAGAAVFAKRCAVCHQLRGVGHEVGPNLASLTDYSPPALLAAMLDPNRAVESKYLDYVAITNAGVTHTGMLVNETGNSITLMGQEGKQQTILRTDLETLAATGKSLMPEGLEKDVNPSDLANVIAYLRGARSPRKVFYANHPRLITPTADGTLQLYATTCEIYGATVVMERLYKNLGYWQSENDRAVWNVELPKAGRYALSVNYACPEDSAGNAWVLEAGGQTLSGKVASTGSWDHYQEMPGGEIDLAAGNQQIVFRSSGPIKGNLLDLGGVLLKPVPK